MSAVKIAESIERAVRSGELAPEQALPPIRVLAEKRGVSPSTVAAAYRALQARGIVVSRGRRGTRVAHRPLYRANVAAAAPPGVRNLSDGNPDPELLPDVSKVLRSVDATPQLYGSARMEPRLVACLRSQLADDGVVGGEIAIVNGAMDGVDRLLAEHLRPGDRVIVEDPGFANLFELVMSRGLSLVPVGLDEEGLLPDALERACRDGANALIVTPRAQTPTGAALSPERARALKRVLKRYPELLLIEDDHGNRISGAPLSTLCGGRSRWAHVRSFSKPLGPDLRIAVIVGDEGTIERVHDRMIVGCRWVSHVLQRILLVLLSNASSRRRVERARSVYTARRDALGAALTARGVAHMGRSGWNVWVPVAAETAAVQALLAAGWLVAAGERFRIRSDPGIRITVATLAPAESARLAEDVAAAVGPRRTVTV